MCTGFLCLRGFLLSGVFRVINVQAHAAHCRIASVILRLVAIGSACGNWPRENTGHIATIFFVGRPVVRGVTARPCTVWFPQRFVSRDIAQQQEVPDTWCAPPRALTDWKEEVHHLYSYMYLLLRIEAVSFSRTRKTLATRPSSKVCQKYTTSVFIITHRKPTYYAQGLSIPSMSTSTSICKPNCLRGTTVNGTYGIHKNLYI